MTMGMMKASVRLFNTVVKRILHSPMIFFDTTPIGRILNRLGRDIEVIDNYLPHNFRYFLIVMSEIIVTIAVASTATPMLMIVIIPLAFVYLFIFHVYVATMRQLRRLDLITRSPLNSHFGESITGIMLESFRTLCPYYFNVTLIKLYECESPEMVIYLFRSTHN